MAGVIAFAIMALLIGFFDIGSFVASAGFPVAMSFLLSIVAFGSTIRILGESSASLGSIRETKQSIEQSSERNDPASKAVLEDRLHTLYRERSSLFSSIIFMINLSLISLGSSLTIGLVNPLTIFPPFYQGVLEVVLSAALSAIIQFYLSHRKSLSTQPNHA